MDGGIIGPAPPAQFVHFFRPLHAVVAPPARSCLSVQWPDGGGLLDVARDERGAADREPGRARGHLVLRVPVHLHAGRRDLERRRKAVEEPILERLETVDRHL